MIKIRYSLAGRSGQRIFHIIVNDSRKKRDSGKKKDYLGFYNPQTKETNVNLEKVADWIQKGAQPTKSLRELIKRKLKEQKKNQEKKE